MRVLSMFLLVLSASCQAPRLVPISYSSAQPEATALGVEVNEKEIFLEHLTDDTRFLVFDVEVINNSQRNQRIDPGTLRLYSSDIPFPDINSDNQHALAASHVTQHSGASNIVPESAEEVDKYLRRQIKLQRAAQVAMLVLGTAMVVTDAIQDSKDASKEYVTRRDVQKAQWRDAATASALVAMDMAGATMEGNIQKRSEDLKYLPEEFFAPQLLTPGSNARGKVFFRTILSDRYYRLILPVDGEGYVFDFRWSSPRERKTLKRISPLN